MRQAKSFSFFTPSQPMTVISGQKETTGKHVTDTQTNKQTQPTAIPIQSNGEGNHKHMTSLRHAQFIIYHQAQLSPSRPNTQHYLPWATKPLTPRELRASDAKNHFGQSVHSPDVKQHGHPPLPSPQNKSWNPLTAYQQSPTLRDSELKIKSTLH